jgi:helicase-like protein
MNRQELAQALPRLPECLDQLKDFQRQTVEYVFRRMYTDPNPTTRFLVADEVGLGKTKVAQGLVARALQHLDDKIERIDIVYVCSNQAIARQNLNRLNPLPGAEFEFATRLTLLPLQLRGLRRNRVNLVSFTPGTAIDTSGGGVWEERAVLFWLLHRGLGDVVETTGTPLRNLLQGSIQNPDSWRSRLDDRKFVEVEEGKPDPEGLACDKHLADAFREAVRQDSGLCDQLRDGVERFKRLREWTGEDTRVRYDVIGKLRAKLALVCVNELEPDIVILDEFQRFQDLLEGETEAAEIARALFNYKDRQHNEARVLLLSATPYRMFTLADEDEDHHRGFLQTFRFLVREDQAEVKALEQDLTRHRAALAAGGDALDPQVTAAAIRDRLLLRMCRTERVALTERQDSMVQEVRVDSPLTGAGVRSAVAMDQVASELGVANPVEYWKSAPYALSFMDQYEMKRTLAEAAGRPSEGLLKALDRDPAMLLHRDDVRQWKPLAVDNGRTHSLAEDTLGKGLWKLLWLPPSLPYITPSGAYLEIGPTTKALVFSCWNVVPDSIAGVLSYEAERRMLAESGETSPYEATVARHALLTFRIDREGEAPRAGAMMTLALLYPSVALATHIDPLTIACDEGEGQPVPLERMREIIRRRFEKLVAEKVQRFGGDTGPVDQRWYWALPALLDLPHTRLLDWLKKGDGAVDSDVESLDADESETPLYFSALFDDGDETERDGGFTLHVDELRNLVLSAKRARLGDPKLLGRPPEDLLETLADLALASPAVCALRALHRVTRNRTEPDAKTVLTAAARVAWGFRTLFSVPETISLLRAREEEEERTPYWRRVLRYCCDGNLQAVLDELVHLKIDDTGTRDRNPDVQVNAIAKEIADALTPRTSNLAVDDIRVRPRAGRIDIETFRLRCRFAMRYGELKDAKDSAPIRATVVKAAFNSPFRPFVLATTSIGQEGLDFHHYCHRVYHWNLPSNPVDLEQREGRVQRYQGHAVRLNIARKFGLLGIRDHWDDHEQDPWDCLFKLAREEARKTRASDIVPYWIFETEGGVSIERRVPMLPLSREHGDLERLKRDLATYRLVFGQPRQEDLLALLQKRGVHRDRQALHHWRVDLTPPEAGSPAVTAKVE